MTSDMEILKNVLISAYNFVKRVLVLRTNKDLEWADLEYFDVAWKVRIKQMVDLVPDLSGQKIMDLGCGKMWLKEYLPDDCTYVPVDYLKRGEDTIICDFNKGEFPDSPVDLIFVSGCLEYIENYKWFIGQVTKFCKSCLISYCSLEYYGDISERRGNAWKNDLSERELINLFEENDFKLSSKISQHNSIFFFEEK